LKMQNISSTYLIHVKGLSAKIGPKGDPIATPSICKNILSRSLKGTLHTAYSHSCLNCDLLNGMGGELDFLNIISRVISTAS
ncbi:unnamed protein product, partial [Rotaria sp. Silwood1]